MTRSIASPALAVLERTGAVYLAGLALAALALVLLARVAYIRDDGSVEFRTRTPAATTVSLGGTHLRVHRVIWR